MVDSSKKPSKVVQVVTSATEFVMAMSMLVMLILVLGNVVLRYGFNSGIASSEDIARFLFIWVIFFGAALGIREGTHLGMDSVIKILPRNGKLAFSLISHVLMLGTIGFLYVGSWEQMILNKDTTALGAVPYPLSWVYASGVVGSIAIGGLIFVNLVRIARGQVSDDDMVMVKDDESMHKEGVPEVAATSVGPTSSRGRSQP